MFCLLCTIYFSLALSVQADYVLPYPSFMPGNKAYRISRVIDSLKAYWYWGNIASFRYHLALADKYLVEAKTLFEYKQYLLAVDALTRSTIHTERLPVYLKRAKSERKDIAKLKATTGEAIDAHVLVLEEITARVPEQFLWQPEKAASTDLKLGSFLRESVNLRQTVEEIITAL